LPKDNAFAARGSEYTRAGKIKNIAIRGFAFENIVGEALKEEAIEEDILGSAMFFMCTFRT